MKRAGGWSGYFYSIRSGSTCMFGVSVMSSIREAANKRVVALWRLFNMNE